MSTERLAAELVEPGESGAWDAFSATHGGSLYHGFAWMRLVRDVFGHEILPLAARKPSGEIAGILPLVRLRSVLFGDFLVSMPFFNYGGPLAAHAEAESALLAEAGALARRLGVSHAEFRCQRVMSGGLPQRLDKVAMILELADDSDSQLARFSAKLRSQIRRPAKEGFSCRIGGAELLADFYRVYAINMRDLGTPVYPLAFFQAVLREAKRHAVVVVERSNQPAAAAIVLHHRETVEVPWASSLREHNRFSVNMLLYWSCIEWALAGGARRFDFGRSTRDGGTYRFKLQWGAEPCQLVWHYWMRDAGPVPNLSPSNPKYAAAIACWRHLPLAITNWLGPRIVRYLP